MHMPTPCEHFASHNSSAWTSSPPGAGLATAQYRQLGASPGVCQAVQLAWKRRWVIASTISRHGLSDILMIEMDVLS